MSGFRADEIERLTARGWHVLNIEGERIFASLPEEVVELGLGVRVLRLGEVRSFDRAALARELRGDA